MPNIIRQSCAIAMLVVGPALPLAGQTPKVESVTVNRGEYDAGLVRLYSRERKALLRKIDHGELIAEARQLDRVTAGPGADIEHTAGSRKVLPKRSQGDLELGPVPIEPIPLGLRFGVVVAADTLCARFAGFPIHT